MDQVSHSLFQNFDAYYYTFNEYQDEFLDEILLSVQTPMSIPALADHDEL
jgi:hypothetical protein